MSMLRSRRSGARERRSARRVCSGPRSSAFDEPYVARPWALARILRREINPLSFAQQFEDRPAHRTAVEEVFDAALIANEAEALVDEESCDSPARHTRSPPFGPRGNPRGCSAGGF